MTTEASEWKGQVLAGRYQVLAPLGEGGMGFVLRARDRKLGCDVVIKVPRPALAGDPEFVGRFTREVRALVQLSHPRIVKVLDVGRHEGLPFAVMQYLPGGSLGQRRDRKPGRRLAPGELRGWLPAIAEALDFIHAQKLVHRDVKPDNILFDQASNAFLSDFGVVKVLATNERRRQTVLTGAGMVLGTAQYMAPELLLGDSYDGRVDQYALAITVYELLSGVFPFDGPTAAAVFVKQTSEPPPRLDQAAGLATALADAVDRALAKRPEQRFATCGDFARAVLAALEAPAVATTAARRVPPLPPPVPNRTMRQALPGETAARRRSTTETPGEGAAAPTRREVLPRERQATRAAHRPRQSRLGLWLGLGAGLAALLLLLAGAGLLVALRSARPAAEQHTEVEAPPEPKKNTRPPPDRQPAEPLEIAPVSRFEGATGSIWSVSISPDGRSILASCGNLVPGVGPAPRDDLELLVWDVTAPDKPRRLRGHLLEVYAGGFCLDGKQVVSGSRDGTLRLWDAGSGNEVRTLTGHTGAVLQLAVSPGGRYALSGSSDRTARLWDLKSGQELRRITGHVGVVQCVAFAPDERGVARHAVTGSHDQSVRVTDLTTGATLRTVEVGALVWSVAVSPDGRRLLVSSGGEFREGKLATPPPFRLSLFDRATGRRLASREHPRRLRHVAYLPDGRRALACDEDGQLRLWDVSDSALELRAGVLAHQASVSMVAVEPAGRWAVSGGMDRLVRQWRLPAAAGPAAAASRWADPAIEPSPEQAPPLSPVAIRPHREPVWSVAVSGDGKLALAGGGAHIADGKVLTGNDLDLRLWHPGEKKPARLLSGHTANIHAVALSPDGKHAASGDGEGNVLLWDTEKGKTARRIVAHRGIVEGIAFSPDGRFIVSGGEDSIVRLWEVETGRKLREFTGHRTRVSGVAYSPDGRLVASASMDKTVRLWDVWTGSLRHELRGHVDMVRAVAFAPDGETLVSGSGADFVDGRWVPGQDHDLRLWSVRTGRQTGRVVAPAGHIIRSVAVSPDGRHALSAGEDRMVYLWDLQTGKERACLAGHGNWVVSVVFTPDGREALTASHDATVRRWKLPPPGPLVEKPAAVRLELRPQLFEGHRELVSVVVPTPDGKRVLSACNSVFREGKLVQGTDRDILVWDSLTMSKALEPLSGHTGTITSLAVSKDSKFALSGSFDQTMRLWDLETGKLVKTFSRPAPGLGPVLGVAFSPDGSKAVSGGHQLVLWNVQTGRPIATYRNPPGHTKAVAFAPDGKSFATVAVNSSIRIWDLRGGLVRELPDPGGLVWGLAFLPDSKRLVAGCGSKPGDPPREGRHVARLYDVVEGRELHTFGGVLGPATCVAVSPDGKQVLAGDASGALRLWDVETGEAAAVLRVHRAQVRSLAYLPDGKHIVSCSYDGTVRITPLPRE